MNILDDTSSLSSTISDSSDFDSLITEGSRDMSLEPSSSTAPQLERLAHLNIQQDEDLSNQVPATLEVKEIELELAPSKPLRKRQDLALAMRKSRYIKVDSSCTSKWDYCCL